MRYAGSITIRDEDGDAVYEQELSADEVIELLIAAVPGDEAGEKEEPEERAVAPRKSPSAKKEKPGAGGKKQNSCRVCGEPGHNAKTCTSKPEAEKPAKQEKIDADARLRVKRMVEGGLPIDEIKPALKRAGFSYSEREVEEMVAWAQHD